MNDKAKDRPGAGGRRQGATRRPATIDLAATEVSEAPQAPEAPAAKGAKASTPSDDAPDQVSNRAGGKTAGKAGSKAGSKAAGKAGDKAGDKSGEKAVGEAPQNPGAGAARPAKDRGAGQGSAGAGPQAAAAPGRRPGVLVFGSGALAGGVVALVLYAGLAQIGVMPAAPGAAGLEARIQDLETHLGDVRDELAGQSGRATRLPEGLARGEEVAALERRVGALETGAAEATGGKTGDALKGFEERLAGLAAQVAAAEQAALSARGEVDILTARLAAQSGSPASAAAAEALGQRLNAAEQAAARAQEAAGAAVRAGEGAILALREQMGQEIGAQAKSLSQRLDTLSADLAALRQQAATDAAQGPGLQARAALAIAIAGLERTMLAGTPFGRELQAVAALSAPGSAQVAALERLAATGVPRADQLAETFAGVAGAIVDAGSRAGGDGLVGRLMANARALVRVRPTGAVSGESTAAVVARIEQKLSAGDLAGAVDEAGALDGAARDAADGWLNSARAALGAREQVRLLAEQAAAGLAAEGGVHKQ